MVASKSRYIIYLALNQLSESFKNESWSILMFYENNCLQGLSNPSVERDLTLSININYK